MGSAAAWALGKRGVRTLALEQFEPGHARGSSHGQSRLIRQAYFEHPDYVPLLRRAYELWDELDATTGTRHFHRQGVVMFGDPDGTVLAGVRRSSELYGVPVEPLAADEAARRYGGAFAVPPGHVGVLEPDAGYLEVERCVRSMTQCAMNQGVTLRSNERVIAVHTHADGVEVETETGRYAAARLVITAGPWSARFLPQVAAKLSVHRVALYWLEAPEAYDASTGLPCFGFDLPDGFYYGVPAIDARGVKVGLHLPREHVEDPNTLDRRLHADECDRLIAFARHCLPGVRPVMTDHATCMYTMTPDEHFVIDNDGPVAFAAGFSGHGFKFATVVGELLADLATTGRSELPAAFLRRRW
jgi:sarcosine oxidase